ncbi:MAG: hypothetical protein K0R59_3091 [Sphingobacterium sp.]|jgi:hypothetical protein|nr:hypothetical protein [Sphingobacterium sp.]
MARIGFLFLVAFCVYFACDRPVFAQPVEFVLQDTVKKKNGKDTLRLDTVQVKRKNELTIKWFREHDRYEKIAYIHKCLIYYLDSVDIIHRRLQFPMGNAKL